MFRLDARFWPGAGRPSRARAAAAAPRWRTRRRRAAPTKSDRRHGVCDRQLHRAQHERPAPPACRSTARIGARSASLPPSRLPTARPPPNTQQDRRHGGFRHAGDARQQRLDVGEHREHAGEAEHRHRQAEQHLRPRQHRELVAQRRRAPAVVGAGRAARSAASTANASTPITRHGPERRAPAEVQAQPGAGRHAEQRGGGEAGEHDRDRRGALLAAPPGRWRPPSRRRRRCRARAR